MPAGDSHCTNSVVRFHLVARAKQCYALRADRSAVNWHVHANLGMLMSNKM